MEMFTLNPFLDLERIHQQQSRTGRKWGNSIILLFSDDYLICYVDKVITTLHHGNTAQTLPVSIVRNNGNCYTLSH